jgi:hypothetical protein
MREPIRMPRALRRLIRSESGIAVPMVLLMVISGLALAGAAIVASIYTQRGSVRDQDSKAALAAADAGEQLALYRQNKVLTTQTLPCLIVSAGSLVPGLAGGDGWCPAVTGTVNGATYTYRVKPPTLVGALQNRMQTKIVSTGTKDGVSRRVATTASTATGTSIFGGAAVSGIDQMVVQNNSQVIGNVGSNSNVDLQNHATLCGDASYGIGQTLNRDNNSTQCAGFTNYEQFLSLPPPDQGTVPPSAGGVNDNGRFFSLDRRTPSSGNSVTWNATTRVLQMHGNSTLTLGGAKYSFCRLVMDGSSSLIAARGAVISIYFDSPENCTSPNGDYSGTGAYNQISIGGSARIITTSQSPSALAFYMVGSDAVQTTATLGGNANVQNELMLYGPRSDITVSGTSSYVGAIAGRTTNINGGALITADPSLNAFNADVLLLYRRERFVECTGGTMPSPPDSAC